MLFTEQLIDCLTNSIVEWLNVSLAKRFFDKRIFESNHQNSNFDYLPFYGDEMLITNQQIYLIRDYIVFILINGLRIYIKTNRI